MKAPLFFKFNLMEQHTINYWLDKIYTYYGYEAIGFNVSLTTLHTKLISLKRELGGNQLINPEGELKKLIEVYLDKS